LGAGRRQKRNCYVNRENTSMTKNDVRLFEHFFDV
jgi:hypothetical protein